MKIRGIVFDKDGTLFDFNATWGAWARTMIASETGEDEDLFHKLADRLGYDTKAERFMPGSIVIAETVDVLADAIRDVLPDLEKAALIARMNAAASSVPQQEAVPLVPFLKQLRSLDLTLGVATNDAEAPARAHLQKSNAESYFDFIVGSDSGFGGKPAPGQLLGFCEAVDIPPENCAMVGDSTHDLLAGRAAGMATIGVLTGPAPASELASFADVVLKNIAEIPGWLTQECL